MQLPPVLVTHQVNIRSTRSGEVLFVARLDGGKRLEVVGLMGE